MAGIPSIARSSGVTAVDISPLKLKHAKPPGQSRVTLCSWQPLEQNFFYELVVY